MLMDPDSYDWDYEEDRLARLDYARELVAAGQPWPLDPHLIKVGDLRAAEEPSVGFP